MIRIGIIGATGYTGQELLRLLVAHPGVEIGPVTSRAEKGRPVADVFPSLLGHVDLIYDSPDTEKLKNCDLVFFATPNGTAMHQVPGLLEVGLKVIDLSADFRLKDPGVWEKWYGEKHACPDLLNEAIYGLPETNRSAIKEARLVANPGCYPTAIQLGFLPLLEADVVDTQRLIANAASGVSGAGRKTAMHIQFCEASDAFKAYNVSGHRHLPEIIQGLESASGKKLSLTFVPHLAPMIRGIHATLYAELLEDIDLQDLFEKRYQSEPFVEVLPPGSHPNTADVRGGNVCRLAVHRPENGRYAVILAVEDNLVKGAAGQAVQNMNIMFGIKETDGLIIPALRP